MSQEKGIERTGIAWYSLFVLLGMWCVVVWALLLINDLRRDCWGRKFCGKTEKFCIIAGTAGADMAACLGNDETGYGLKFLFSLVTF